MSPTIERIRIEGLRPNELLLGITEGGLAVGVDLKEDLIPIFVIAQVESNTHGLLMLAAASCRQSSPSRQIIVVTEDPSAWRDINPDFVTTPGDPRLADRLAQMLNQKDGHNLLIFEGLEHGGQMPKAAKQHLHALLKNGHEYGNVQVIASVNPDQIPGGIDQLITTYLDGQLIWGITKFPQSKNLRPNEFLAAGMGEDHQALRFSLPGK